MKNLVVQIKWIVYTVASYSSPLESHSIWRCWLLCTNQVKGTLEKEPRFKNWWLVLVMSCMLCCNCIHDMSRHCKQQQPQYIQDYRVWLTGEGMAGSRGSRSNIPITMATKRCISMSANHLPGHWYLPPPNPTKPSRNWFFSRSQSNHRSYK